VEGLTWWDSKLRAETVPKSTLVQTLAADFSNCFEVFQQSSSILEQIVDRVIGTPEQDIVSRTNWLLFLGKFGPMNASPISRVLKCLFTREGKLQSFYQGHHVIQKDDLKLGSWYVNQSASKVNMRLYYKDEKNGRERLVCMDIENTGDGTSFKLPKRSKRVTWAHYVEMFRHKKVMPLLHHPDVASLPNPYGVHTFSETSSTNALDGYGSATVVAQTASSQTSHVSSKYGEVAIQSQTKTQAHRRQSKYGDVPITL
jgi:hypothetical protein